MDLLKYIFQCFPGGLMFSFTLPGAGLCLWWLQPPPRLLTLGSVPAVSAFIIDLVPVYGPRISGSSHAWPYFYLMADIIYIVG